MHSLKKGVKYNKGKEYNQYYDTRKHLPKKGMPQWDAKVGRSWWKSRAESKEKVYRDKKAFNADGARTKTGKQIASGALEMGTIYLGDGICSLIRSVSKFNVTLITVSIDFLQAKTNT